MEIIKSMQNAQDSVEQLLRGNATWYYYYHYQLTLRQSRGEIWGGFLEEVP
jgi:hypothetical protein